MNIRYEVIAAANGVQGDLRLFAFLCNETPADALAKAQRSTDWHERVAIAINPNTPPEVVKRLAKDGNAVVRSIAAHALANRTAPVSPYPLQESAPSIAASMKIVNQSIAIELIDRIRDFGFSYGFAGTRWFKYLKTSQKFGYPIEMRHYSSESNEFSRLELKPPSLDQLTLLPASVQELVWHSLASDADPSVRKAVSRSSCFPAALFATFASDPEANVRKNILSRQDLPHNLRLSVLTGFSDNKEEWARIGLASDPLCPVATMQKLAKSKSFYVFEALAKNSSCPVDLLAPMLKSMADLIRKNGYGSYFAPTRLYEIVGASVFPAAVLQSLAKSKDSLLRVASATAQNHSLETFKVLGEDTDYLVRLAVAKNQAAPLGLRNELFLRLSKDKESSVRKAVAASRDCPPDLLAKLAKDRNNQVKDAAIACIKCVGSPLQSMDRGFAAVERSPKPAPDFDALACSSNQSDRVLASENQACPPSVLERLAGDQFNRIRINVALHLNCPINVLKILSADTDVWVRRCVAYNLACPPEIRVQLLQTLALDSNYQIRRWIAEHALTPIETLAVLAHDSTLAVREAVGKPDHRKLNQDSFIAQDLKTSPDELMRLAKTGLYLTRLEALSNPSFPSDKRSDVLAEISADIMGWFDGALVDTPIETFEDFEILQALDRLKLIPSTADKKAMTNASMSKDWLERVAVLLANGVPRSVMRLLSEDENETVRNLAIHRLETHTEPAGLTTR